MPESIYNLSIFKGIDKETIRHIILNCKEISFKAGEKIIVEGEGSNGEGYIIKSGKVSISFLGNKIAELSEGNIFGEIALLNEGDRTASVTAIEDCITIVLSLDDLIEMINNDDNTINKTIMKRIEENLER